ncbi:P-loop containing nucleoside triphosphate hydrolase protein [Favolaschia claudopus]|uniref:DNA 3'-5' helicase n=1 Tax=Favolaschia claudopus TaxID=2862362 RepID=A0AAW0AL73_9AGAR
MPFKPLAALDPQKLDAACENFRRVFGVPSLYRHQCETGENILKGVGTFLNTPGNTQDNCQKIILVVGPLTTSLTQKGFPAVALTSETEESEQVLKVYIGNDKYRIVFVSPELAVTPKSHENVLSRKPFSDNIISRVINEGHCISEWGNDDFRPEFSKLSLLLARLASGLPVVVGSATLHRDVVADIQGKLRLRRDCARVSLSEKPNIALSVRIMQHPQDTFADLLTLFPREFDAAEDFPQTNVYAGGRLDVEKIQDFCRANKPDHIDAEVFEFYHRFIAQERKALL